MLKDFLEITGFLLFYLVATLISMLPLLVIGVLIVYLIEHC